MKKFSDFEFAKPAPPPEIVPDDLEPEVLEASDLPDFAYEAKDNKQGPMDPPAVLIMRRKTVRVFPNGQRVAMYYVDKINKYVTVPYVGMQWGTATPEETEYTSEIIGEDILGHLNDITLNGHKPVRFKDGSSTVVDMQTAHAILKVHGALNDKNKKKLSNMAAKSKHHFSKVVDFAWKNIK